MFLFLFCFLTGTVHSLCTWLFSFPQCFARVEWHLLQEKYLLILSTPSAGHSTSLNWLTIICSSSLSLQFALITVLWLCDLVSSISLHCKSSQWLLLQYRCFWIGLFGYLSPRVQVGLIQCAYDAPFLNRNQWTRRALKLTRRSSFLKAINQSKPDMRNKN